MKYKNLLDSKDGATNFCSHETKNNGICDVCLGKTGNERDNSDGGYDQVNSVVAKSLEKMETAKKAILWDGTPESLREPRLKDFVTNISIYCFYRGKESQRQEDLENERWKATDHD